MGRISSVRVSNLPSSAEAPEASSDPGLLWPAVTDAEGHCATSGTWSCRPVELQCHTADAWNTSRVVAGGPERYTLVRLGPWWGGKQGKVLLSMRGGRRKIPTSWSSSLYYFCCRLHTYSLYSCRRVDDFPLLTRFTPSSLDENAAMRFRTQPLLMPLCFDMNSLGSQEVCSEPLLGSLTSFGCHFPQQYHKCWT